MTPLLAAILTGLTVTAGPIAVLPAENLSGVDAPLDAIEASLRLALQDRGFEVLPEEALDGFMHRHRLRDVGGLAPGMGEALRAETGAASVLVTSVDLYEEADPPRVALTARLVTAGEEPGIIWMDSAAQAGDAEPGFLGLGLIDDVQVLEDRIVTFLGDSLAASLSATAPPVDGVPDPGPRRFRPRSLYRTRGEAWLAGPAGPEAAAPASHSLRVAVLPFANDSAAKNAGDLLTLQMVRQVRLMPGVEVIEPGVVREALLRAHLIQEEGLSLPQADLVRLLLEADLVLFGEVSVYVEVWAGAPEPEVDFSARLLSTRTRQVVCAAISHARGDEGAWFFGLGRVPTAHDLTARLARGFVAGCLTDEGRP
jgi:hypothetical protein